MESVQSKDINETQLPIVTSADVLKQALFFKLNTRIVAHGEIAFPCLPHMVDHYTQWILQVFQILGRPLPPEKHPELRQLLVDKLQEGYQQSSSSMLILKYTPVEPPHTGFACHFRLSTPQLDDQYKNWVQTRQPPLFGSHPDAKLMATAQALGPPATVRVLDVGAGTGRNTLPLARLGHPVDAIELTPTFAGQLRGAVEAEGLGVRVIEGDILSPLVRVRPAYYQLIVAAEVISHFRDVDQLRLFFAKMSDFLCPGGCLLISMFITVAGYEPSPAVRELAELAWSTLYTRQELADALVDLPLTLISDDWVLEYEKSHLPPEAWPPTNWYSTWVTGRDIFPIANGRPPIEFRWLLFRRH